MGIYQISKPVSESFYDLPAMIHTRVQGTIFVMVKFPLAVRGKDYTLYHIDSLPLPVEDNSTHATKIHNIPPYLAINTGDNTYIEMTQQQYATCTGIRTKRCNYIPAPILATKPTCAVALFKSDVKAIKATCDMRFQPNALETYALEISDGKFIFSNIKQFILSCPRLQVKTMKGCSLCVYSIPCKCAVEASGIKIYPRLNNCDESKDTQILHSTNIPLLLEFFSEEAISNLTADSVFPNKLKINIPSFKIAEQKVTDILKADEKYAIKLSAIVRKAKQLKPIKLRPIDTSSIGGMLQYDQPPNMWNIICIILTILNAVAMYMVYRKLKLIMLLIPMAAPMLHTGKAASLDWAETQQTTAATINSNTRYLDIFANESHGLVVASAILITMIILYALGRLAYASYTKYREITSNESSIMVEISDTHHTIRVAVLQVASPPKAITMQANNWISRATITGTGLHKQMFINWGDLAFYIGANQTQVRPHSLMPLSTWQARQLSVLLQTEYTMHIAVAFKGTVTYISPTTGIETPPNPSAPPSSSPPRYPSILEGTRL
jgi:hypothetical protein